MTLYLTVVSFLYTFKLLPMALALAFSGPHDTVILDAHPTSQWAPRLTSPPSPALLHARLDSQTQSTLYNGQNSWVWRCYSDYSLSFESSAWGCCGGSPECLLATVCIDNPANTTSFSHGTIGCFSTDIPYCATVVVSGRDNQDTSEYTSFFCSESKSSGILTWYGYTGAPKQAKITTSQNGGATTVTVTGTKAADSASAPAGISNQPESPNETSTVPTPTPTPSSSSKSSLSGGAIAGIVIGGVAGLALLATGVILFLRHKKKAERTRPMMEVQGH